MSTHAINLVDEDTHQVARPAALPERPRLARVQPHRLADMDLDPPDGPVPSAVVAYFEAALERQRLRTSG